MSNPSNAVERAEALKAVVKELFRQKPAKNYGKGEYQHIRYYRHRALTYFDDVVQFDRSNPPWRGVLFKEQRAYNLKMAVKFATLGGADKETLLGALELLSK